MGSDIGSDIHVMLTKAITKKAQKTICFERFHNTSWLRESRLGCNAPGAFQEAEPSHRCDQKIYLRHNLLKEKV